MSSYWFNRGLDDAANGETCNHPENPHYSEGYDSVPNRERDLRQPDPTEPERPEREYVEEDFIDLDEDEEEGEDE